MIIGAFIGVLFVRAIMQTQLLARPSAGTGCSSGLELLTMLVAAAFGALFSLLLSFASINLRPTRPSAARR